MKWGILGALDAEVDLIRNKMTITSETPLFGTVFYEGTVGREQIVLVCCGVGKVNAAVCAAAVMNQFEQREGKGAWEFNRMLGRNILKEKL